MSKSVKSVKMANVRWSRMEQEEDLAEMTMVAATTAWTDPAPAIPINIGQEGIDQMDRMTRVVIAKAREEIGTILTNNLG